MPFSTDSHGRYISHVVSAASGSNGGGATASAFGSRRRVARSAPEMPSFTSSSSRHLFFNVTVFGKELHLRLRANRKLVAPGAFVEWQEDFEEKAKERIHRDCVFTGDVSDMPEASVAISNCDGLVSHWCRSERCSPLFGMESVNVEWYELSCGCLDIFRTMNKFWPNLYYVPHPYVHFKAMINLNILWNLLSTIHSHLYKLVRLL